MSVKATNGPTTLLEAIRYFEDEDVCHDTLSAIRWPDGVIPCPNCSHTDHYFLKTRRVWKCKQCAKQFSVKVGTIFEDSPLKLSKWLPCVWMICGAKNGISSYEIHRALGVTQKTAWFMLHRIREAMRSGSFEKLGGEGNGKVVEIDETFIGGKAANMHFDKKERLKMKQGTKSDKDVVMGFLERGSIVRLYHVPNTKSRILVPKVRENVLPRTNLYSDANPSYVTLGRWFRHDFVDHALTYVVERVHTNGLENFWSLLKRTMRGTYVAVDSFHLSRYLDEYTFRYNARKGTDADRFYAALSQVSGRRVTYKELTGKIPQG